MAYGDSMRAWLALALGVVAGAAGVCRGQAAGAIFDVGASRATRAVVTVRDVPVPEGETVGMLGAVRGVLADLRGKGLGELRACLPANPFLGDAGSGELVCMVRLYGRAPGKGEETSKRVGVYRGADGSFVAVEMDADPESGRPDRRGELRRGAFTELMATWPLYRGGFDEPDPAVLGGEPQEMVQPYEVGRYLIDAKTLRERFSAGPKSGLPESARVLEREKLFVRLPARYDPRTPAGLVVWIDPGGEGAPPEPLWHALDELNLIGVGAAGAGNSRVVTERYQLVFDAVATVSVRHHVDPRRVYLTGLSGGGRVSSILLGTFPDEFAGAVPIAGMSCYQPVPTGVGRAWPAGYARPGSRVFNIFKTRRMAGMTGDKDFNSTEMRHAADIMRGHGAAVKLFDYPDMGHTLPRPERFLEALSWVDEPYRAVRREEEEAAGKAMEAYLARHGEGPPGDEAARKMLVKVTEAGPWTAAAWRAAELLGAVPARADGEGAGQEEIRSGGP